MSLQVSGAALKFRICEVFYDSVILSRNHSNAVPESFQKHRDKSCKK